jgi:pimeloyl-ACP methyl ester carboxylesterase
VIFLHGIAARSDNWQPVIEALDLKNYRCIALDVLGFGESPKPDWLEYDVDNHADAVIATIRKLKIKRPVTLVGHSMGTLIAARVARKEPKMVKHLILYQMPVYSDYPGSNGKESPRLRLYMSVYRKMLSSRKMTLRSAELISRFASRAVGFYLNDELWTPFEMSLRNTIMQQEIYQDLEALPMKTDVVYGRFDMFVMRGDTQKYLEKSNHVRFHEINELHRITPRAAKLLSQLIVTNKV